MKKKMTIDCEKSERSIVGIAYATCFVTSRRAAGLDAAGARPRRSPGRRSAGSRRGEQRAGEQRDGHGRQRLTHLDRPGTGRDRIGAGGHGRRAAHSLRHLSFPPRPAGSRTCSSRRSAAPGNPSRRRTSVSRSGPSRSGLNGLGIQPGDRVAILSENRPEWAMADYAILCAGAWSVPIYPTLPAGQVAPLLNDCGARAIFVSTLEQLGKILTIRAQCPDARPRDPDRGQPAGRARLRDLPREWWTAAGRRSR